MYLDGAVFSRRMITTSYDPTAALDRVRAAYDPTLRGNIGHLALQPDERYMLHLETVFAHS